MVLIYIYIVLSIRIDSRWEVWSVSMPLCCAGGVLVEFKVQVESSVVVYFVVHEKGSKYRVDVAAPASPDLQ